MEKKEKIAITRRKMAVMNAIPVYPDSVSIKDINRKFGLPQNFVMGFPADAPLCEDGDRPNTTLCFLSQESKKEYIKRYEVIRD